MSKFTDSLLDSIPKEIDYLLKTYCQETNYLELDNIKQKHKEYLINAIRILRRCIETQLFEINNDGIRTLSLCNQMLTLCLQYYNGIAGQKSASDLRTACIAFQEEYNKLADDLKHIKKDSYYFLFNDITPGSVPKEVWPAVALKARQQFTLKGNHLNVFIPYPGDDMAYIGTDYNDFLENLWPESWREYYSFYTQNLNDKLFASGKYLSTSKERANLKSKSFDVVITTHNNMFDTIRPRINAATSYLKKNGTMIILGMTTDFKRLDLRRIAAALQDIQVYFATARSFGFDIHNCEACMVVGRVKDPSSPSEFVKLLDIFAMHTSEEAPFMCYGSEQNEKPVFASYDITETEAEALLPEIRTIAEKVITALIPKTTEDTRRPLLPFSSGQLGLVLISGDINGVIQESESQCRHVVKGSSRQREDNKIDILETNADGQPTKIRRTKSVYASTNVNVILPTGELKELH